MKPIFKYFKDLRKQLIIWLFEKSQSLYITYFKRTKTPWRITKAELLQLPQDSFGNHLGKFLDQNNFKLIPKVERHDCYHVLCGYDTKVEDEIALQCLCYGNGKQSLYLYSVILLGIIILPDYYRYYYKSYKIGKDAVPFFILIIANF